MYYDINKINRNDTYYFVIKRRIKMTIINVKCVCGCEEVYFREHPKSIGVLGIYCTTCGRWIKWANKAEKRLYKLEIDREKRSSK